MKRRIKLLISLGVYTVDRCHAFLRRCAGLPEASRVVALYYHAVRPEQRAGFSWQMDELLRRAQPFLLDDRPLPGAPGLHVAVTFDDGFTSVIEQALPELLRRGIPCSIFVPTGCLGQQPSWILNPNHPSHGERVISEEELRDLVRVHGVHVGSHSVTHPRLDALDADAAAAEMRQSKAVLEEILDCEVTTFSYPHGARNAALDELARAIGYRRVLSIDPTPLTPFGADFVAGRVAAEPDDGPVEFRLKLMGAYRWQSSVGRNGRPRT